GGVICNCNLDVAGRDLGPGAEGCCAASSTGRRVGANASGLYRARADRGAASRFQRTAAAAAGGDDAGTDDADNNDAQRNGTQFGREQGFNNGCNAASRRALG